MMKSHARLFDDVGACRIAGGWRTDAVPRAAAGAPHWPSSSPEGMERIPQDRAPMHHRCRP